MDNRLFVVNGKGVDLLSKTLEIAYMQQSWGQKKDRPFIYYGVIPKLGLVLSSVPESGLSKFIAPCTAAQVAETAHQWINNLTHDEAVEFTEGKVSELGEDKWLSWTQLMDFDGSIDTGWSVSVGDWGHIGNFYNGICVIKPCYLWYGS